MENFFKICENRDFRRIYAKGKSFVSPAVVIYVMKNRYKNIRVGITTSKKTGNAVKRNRSKRVIREAFRMVFPQVLEGYDLIFVARGKTPFLKSTEMTEILLKQFAKAGILK